MKIHENKYKLHAIVPGLFDWEIKEKNHMISMLKMGNEWNGHKLIVQIGCSQINMDNRTISWLLSCFTTPSTE